ncbi:MAG: hypothetical protein KA964_08055 [Comamonas sp.]|nr:hypothetical protein [Comamonas sp.]
MSRSTRRWSQPALFMLAAALAAPAFAADPAPAAAAAPAPGDAAAPQQQQAPKPNPAAEKALGQRFQSIFAAFEGKAALPDSKSFSEEFNKQVTPEQMKEVLQQVHQSVGACRVAAQMRVPTSYASGYLLQCDKAFVPMDIAVEEKAPYRIHSLLIRPGYWKK